MVIRGAIGSIVSLSSNNANGRLPGAICGDFASQWVSANGNIEVTIAVQVGTKWSDRITTARWSLAPKVGRSSGSWVTFSYVQTGVSARTSGWFGMFTNTSSLKYGDFMISAGQNFACRNLWIDTSKPI